MNFNTRGAIEGVHFYRIAGRVIPIVRGGDGPVAAASTDLLGLVRTKIKGLNEDRQKAIGDLDAASSAAVAEGRTDLNETEMTARKEARDRIDAIDLQLDGTDAEPGLLARETELAADAERRTASDELAKRLGSQPAPVAPVGQAHVRSEPTVYGQGSGRSYFRDIARANAPGGGDEEARTRLRRHAQEISVDLEARANMDLSDGTGGEFVPPTWLMDKYVPLARAGRVTADLCHREALPAGTDRINLPKVATGGGTAKQTIGSTVQKTDITTTSTGADVVTLAGQQVFAMQLIDQSPLNFDEVVFSDLLGALAVNVDTYAISTATIGILNLSGINAVTYTDADPTVQELYPKGADGIQKIGTGRFLPAQAHVMHPRRWAWHTAALDTTGRPLVVPSAQGPTNAFAGMTDVRAEGAAGTWQGLPVYLDANIPTNLGSGTNEDRIITARFDDLNLYESTVRSRVLYETDADTLSVRLQVWEYAAFLAGRYPKSISVIAGTGLVTPTF